MRNRRLFAALAAAVFAAAPAACTDLEVTDPTNRTTDTFWRTEADAVAGTNAIYRSLQGGPLYGQWAWMAIDGRSDLNVSRSPWGDLANFTRTVFVNYDFPANIEGFQERYRAIFRANQVLANVPNIQMTEALKNRLQAEAKFLRALLYHDLAMLWGNVPIVTELPETADRPETRPRAEVWAQALRDATEAAAVLPVTYSGGDRGRPTRGAALALAGRIQIQQQRWADAATLFQQVVALAPQAGYALTPTYAENFVVQGDLNSEAVFEVAFGGPNVTGQGTRGNFIARLVGPPAVGFTDVQPAPWYFQAFFRDNGPGNPDPRLFHTIFYNRPGGMDVYGRPFATRYPTGFRETGINDTYFWKKHGEYYLTFQDDNSAINYKLIRYADVLLMLAEALNESGRTAEALPLVNQIRARANNGAPANERLAPLPAGLSQAQMRDRIEHEFLMELGWENQRWPYLARHGQLTRAYLTAKVPARFADWVDARGGLLPIPQSERDLNPGVQQNPGWN